MCIINGDVHQFVGLCLIPLDPSKILSNFTAAKFLLKVYLAVLHEHQSVSYKIISKFLPNLLLMILTLITGKEGTLGHYTRPQSFYTTFSYLLASKIWGLLLYFDWLVHEVEYPNLLTIFYL